MSFVTHSIPNFDTIVLKTCIVLFIFTLVCVSKKLKISESIMVSKKLLRCTNLLEKSQKSYHEKKFSALRLHLIWVNYSIKRSLGTGAYLMLWFAHIECIVWALNFFSWWPGGGFHMKDQKNKLFSRFL